MKLSVITPSYNYARFIPNAIDSTSADGACVEHIVMDGGSDDGTQEVLASYGDRLTWRSEPDKGQSDALNKALSLANGDIIGWLNADDFYLPGALDRVIREFENDPELDVLYGDTVLVDGTGRLIRLYKCYNVPSVVLRWRGCTLMSTSTFIRRRVLGDQPFDTGLRMRMDWDLFLRLKRDRKVKFRYLAEPLAAFRFHEEQVTHNQVDYRTAEHYVIRERYRISSALVAITRPIGIAVHRLMKAVNGAWLSERRSLKLAGTRLIGECGEVEAVSIEAVRDACYSR